MIPARPRPHYRPVEQFDTGTTRELSPGEIAVIFFASLPTVFMLGVAVYAICFFKH